MELGCVVVPTPTPYGILFKKRRAAAELYYNRLTSCKPS